MDKLIAKFTQQLSEALAIGREVSAPKQTQIDNILCCGLGGSGIGAKITKLLNRDFLSVPFDSVNDYNIPAFVNEKTLVIAASYSGNTEETLMAVEACITKGAKIAVISSDGSLLEMAKDNNWLHYVVPGGEQPRAMLAYSLVLHFYILKAFNLINYDFESQITEAIKLIDSNENEIVKEAKVVAEACHGKIPVIYSNPTMEGVAVRFRQQLNENSKMLAWHAVIPEMNHNELVGWAGGSENIAVIKLSNSLEFYRNTKRWEYCKPVIEKKAGTILEVIAAGNNVFEQALYLIHVTDWVTFYLAELKAIDPTEVEVISSLKSKLSGLK
ncbi:MAG: bifunctional phosphoglucose/phosphomannose isomerase [Crocinitomicaceae bacterium]